MSKKSIGIVLIIVGIVVVVGALGADSIGLGVSAGVGLHQALAATVGIIIAAVGAWFWPGFPQMSQPISLEEKVHSAPTAAVETSQSSNVAQSTPKRKKSVVAKKAARKPAAKSSKKLTKRRK